MRHPAENVAGRVRPRLQAGGFDTGGQPAPRGQVGFRAGHAVDAAVGTAADARQLGEVGQQPVSRDAWRRQTGCAR